MSELSSKFRSFDDVAKALIAITDKVKGTKTKIKLVGRTRDNRVVAEIPTITSVFDGVATITDNYIGNKLFFTPYEEGKRNEYLKGTPTDMEKVPASDPLMGVAQETPAEDELDLESLL
jgi:hypothetical protein